MSENKNPRCPICGLELVIKTNRKTNEKFYGCSGYPDCRFSVGVNNDGKPDIEECFERKIRRYLPKLRDIW